MLSVGREITGHPEAALRREWLATNGIGGFAMGSLLASAPTRRYHGLLVAALEPPLGRTLLLAGLDIAAVIGGRSYQLSSLERTGGSIAPDGHRHIERFALEGGTPVFTFALEEALVEQRIWMEHGRNTTYVQLRHVRGDRPIELALRTLVTARDYHAPSLDAAWYPEVRALDDGLLVEPGAPFPPLTLRGSGFTAEVGVPDWETEILHRIELERQHDETQALAVAGALSATLRPGGQLTLVCSCEAGELSLDGPAALARERARAAALVRLAAVEDQPAWVQQLALAADQFIISRASPGGSGASVIAGYPWFTDWGRDTMIALPGLTLATGRPDLARSILRTFAHYISQGMLPNRFPDGSEEPEYNTVDATLWFFEAVRQTIEATGDRALARELYPRLTEIVEWHRRGTRYGIVVDADGLLRSGTEGVQLTWMDVKVDDWVVTPRTGKAVEINALWHNALGTLCDLALLLGREHESEVWGIEARRVRTAFERFWYAEGGYLYDVLDTPEGGDDHTLRPNQLLAVALHHAPLEGERAKAVVDVCARTLLTSYGLRSLAPDEEQYAPLYLGDRRTRDGCYHQGTVWSWLIGPFVAAHLKMYGDQAAALRFLEPFADHLLDAGMGSISEIFDADAPHTPRGCPAQAWGVAEVLRLWRIAQSLIQLPIVRS